MNDEEELQERCELHMALMCMLTIGNMINAKTMVGNDIKDRVIAFLSEQVEDLKPPTVENSISRW